ncbi:MAG: hypothetical protein K6E63_06265 [Lachnospiraceae bacterium]|nr:hypothetical protein [Lachnospiraceae bacterium]
MSYRKITALIMALSVLAMTGCSSNAAGNLSETGNISTEKQETAQADNDVSVPDSTAGTLEVPKVNDGVNYFEADYISIHFNWNAIDGAEGYEVSEETAPEDGSDDNYGEPVISEVTDHYYLTGGQDDFVHRIKVRAFKTEGGSRVFSDWSDYAIGKESNPIVGVSSAFEDSYDKNAYLPVLDEYAKVFKGDESVYGMRAPDALYYKVNSFDSFNINDFSYAFCDYGPDDNDDVVLLILKEKDGKDCLYSLVYYGLYSLSLDFVTDSVTDDYSSTDIGQLKEGEDLFLYDKGIIARSRDEKDCSIRNYIRIVYEPDMVPYYWKLITTVASVTDSSGNIKYYKSDVYQSLDYDPNEKTDLYEEISEDEFNKIQKEYEVPANIVKYPLADYTGARFSNEEGDEEAIEAYASFIKERAADPQYPFLGFTLIHLDEDDTPELAIAYGGSHADGVGFYGFDSSGVNEICVTGSLGLAYYEKGSGIIYGWYTGQGATCYNIAIVKDGKLKEKIAPEITIQYDENFEETGYKYYTEEEGDISKEKFEEILAPYSPEKRQYRELEYSKLHDVHNTSDIAKALKDSLAEEDNLPKPDMDYYHTNIIVGK